MNTQPTLTFCTGVDTVTGADFLLETPAGSKILIDCGLIQGERVAMAENHADFFYNPADIDILIVTHAHLDHVGRIPKLVKDGFIGTIYSTPQTRELAELILNDAVGILGMEARQNNVQPLYTLEDVQHVFPLWKTVAYHEHVKIADDISIYLKDAGHILGSAMVEVTHIPTKEVILFTGDLGNSPAPLLRDAEPVGDVDYLVMESVYGDRNHEAREERVEKFEEIIKSTIARGGTLVIPAFAVDRTQVLLYELNDLVENNKIPSVPIFVDSPLATKVTDVYRSNTALFNDAARAQIEAGDNLFSFPHLSYTMSQGESQNIDEMKGAKIILAGSGMSVGGRIIGHEEIYLPDPHSTILLVGYQTAGSLGRQLSDGAKKVKIHGREVEVKAHIETLFGFSAHKDADHLVEFVATAGNGGGGSDGSGGHKLKKVSVVMGEPKAAMHLSQRLNDELGVKAVVPARDKVYEV